MYVQSGMGVGVASLAAITSLRSLSLNWADLKTVYGEEYLEHYLWAEESDILTRLPRLPALTRLTARRSVRFARFELNTLPDLRVLDLRGSNNGISVHESCDLDGDGITYSGDEKTFYTPVFPSFADNAFPSLSTLLLGFAGFRERGTFHMLKLLFLPPTVRVVVIEHAVVAVYLTGTVETRTARVRERLVHASLHWHDCVFGDEDNDQLVSRSADVSPGPEQEMVAALRGGVAKWCECEGGCMVCTLLEAGWGDDVRK